MTGLFFHPESNALIAPLRRLGLIQGAIGALAGGHRGDYL